MVIMLSAIIPFFKSTDSCMIIMDFDGNKQLMYEGIIAEVPWILCRNALSEDSPISVQDNAFIITIRELTDLETENMEG